MKKIIFILLFLNLSFLFGQSYSGGDGTSGDPFQIANKDDLKYLSENSAEWAKYYIQTADISFAASDFDSGGAFYNTGEGFIPIGNVTTQFTGSYDGQGHTISNMKINRSSDCVGFFGYTNSASNVSNLGIVSCNISGGNNTGGLIGANSSTSVSNCFVTGSVSGGSSVGGLAGQVSNNSQISNCYSRASVSGGGNAGGLVGSNSSSTISKCYSTGGVGGGVIGLGGLVGSNTGTVTDSFWDIQASGKTTSNGGVGKTTEDMKSYEIYYLGGWDFIDETDNGTSNYWGLNAAENDGYPFLAWQNYTNNIPLTVVINSITDLTSTTLTANGNLVKLGSGSVTEHGFCWSTSENPTITDSKIENGSTSATGTFSSNISGLETATTYYLKAFATDAEGTKYSAQKSFSTLPGGGGDGTSNNPYVISELRDLQWIMNNQDQWNKHFIQTADIDASATSGWDGGQGFLPIGNFTTQFTGSYDGQGHTISNLKINRPSTDYIGIFGYVNGSSAISNLGIVNCDITGNMFTGGLIGCSVDSQIDKCYVTGNIQGRDYLGGFIGRNMMATITNSYADVTVDGNTYIGGFIGVNSSTISNCYSTSVINSAGNIGGLVATGGGTVTNSFWDTETSGTTSSVGGAGKTTAEMKDITTYLNAGWDFSGETANGTDDIWGINIGRNNGYPYLKWQFPNTAPTGNNKTVAINEDTDKTFAVGDFTFNDVDGDAFAGIQVTLLETKGSLKYNGTDVTLNQEISDVTKFVYSPLAGESGSPYATFKFKVYDGTVYSVSEYTMTISVNALPKTPVIAEINSEIIKYTEGDAAVSIISSLSITDPDDTELKSATVSVKNYQNAEDVIGYSASGGITASFNEATGTITFTGNALIADYISSLTSITYSNNSETPTEGLRTFSFSVNDGINNSNSVGRSVKLNLIKSPVEAPTNLIFSSISGTSFSGSFTPSTTAKSYLVVRKAGSAPTFSPIDKIEYSTGAQGDDEIISVGSGTGFTEPNVEAGVEYYYSVFAYNGTGAKCKYCTASLSGKNKILAGSTDIEVDLPTTTEPVSTSFPDAGVDISFPDGSNGTKLTVSKTTKKPEANIGGVSGIKGLAPLYFSIHSSNDNPGNYTIILDFSSLNVSDWTNFKVLKRADENSPWKDVEHAPFNATITNRATDGIPGKFTITGLSSFSEFAVGETTSASTPTTTGIPNVNVDEDSPNTLIKLTDYFDDVEDGSAGLTYKVVSISDSTLFTSVTISENILTLDYAANKADSVNITIRATDKSNDYIETTFSVFIKNANDIPTGGDVVLTIDEDENRVFKTTDFVFIDVDKDSLCGIEVTALETKGSLLFDGNDVTLNQKCIDVSKLTYIPAFEESGEAYATFKFKVYDGTTYSIEEYTMTINVLNVFDKTKLTGIDTTDYLFTEGDPEINILKSILVSDDDDTTLTSAKVFLSENYTENEDLLNYSKTSNLIIGQYNSPGSLSLIGKASIEEYQKVLRSITYINKNQADPSELKRTISVVINDGTVNSDTTKIFVNVVSINEKPKFTNLAEIIIPIIDSVHTFCIWNCVKDEETLSKDLNYAFKKNGGDIFVDYNNITGEVKIRSQNDWYGDAELKIKVTDEEGESVEENLKVRIENNVTGINQLTGIPEDYVVYQNYPNPFNPSTVIRYGIPEHSDVRVQIYSITGELVEELVNNLQEGGYYEISWNCGHLSSGIYIYRVMAKSQNSGKIMVETKKMLLVK